MTSNRPYNLVAELTYRCPLRCVYCSNPLDFRGFAEKLSAEDWCRVFAEAAALGTVHVGLTGGEPSARADLPEIVAGVAEAGLYSHLVTAGTPIDAEGLGELVRVGLRSVQLSFQDSSEAGAAEIAGGDFFEKKLAFAEAVRSLGLPLTINVVLHRRNLPRLEEIIALSRQLDADRLELANTQYHGWALRNRDALMPSLAQLEEAERIVESARGAAKRPEILFVLPDYFRGRPKPCMGGWGRRTMVIAPDGRVFPCHGAAELPGLEFWSVPEHPLDACWKEAPGMNAFRGNAWLPEPCQSCPEKERDFGGCRCQAFALTGVAAVTDPACDKSAHHVLVRDAREAPAAATVDTPLVLRGNAT